MPALPISTLVAPRDATNVGRFEYGIVCPSGALFAT
jgi:hypothetical protein